MYCTCTPASTAVVDPVFTHGHCSGWWLPSCLSQQWGTFYYEHRLQSIARVGRCFTEIVWVMAHAPEVIETSGQCLRLMFEQCSSIPSAWHILYTSDRVGRCFTEIVWVMAHAPEVIETSGQCLRLMFKQCSSIPSAWHILYTSDRVGRCFTEIVWVMAHAPEVIVTSGQCLRLMLCVLSLLRLILSTGLGPKKLIHWFIDSFIHMTTEKKRPKAEIVKQFQTILKKFVSMKSLFLWLPECIGVCISLYSEAKSK
jgi:hypothetical protein